MPVKDPFVHTFIFVCIQKETNYTFYAKHIECEYIIFTEKQNVKKNNETGVNKYLHAGKNPYLILLHTVHTYSDSKGQHGK